MSRLWRVLAPAVAAVALLLGMATPARAAADPPTCNGAVWVPLDAGTRDATRFVPMHSYSLDCMLELGDYDNFGVVALQEALITCYGQSITRDGDFGPNTEKALKTVQAWEQYVNHKPIGVTGVYKAATEHAIKWPTYVNGHYDRCRYWEGAHPI